MRMCQEGDVDDIEPLLGGLRTYSAKKPAS